mmetsp:Transcript_11248/g.33781  ORF Transcript_11248/g.33781 Transcript_11248/m.33781 type:complete len:83 (-) Transcript_11248:2807-3055(-)
MTHVQPAKLVMRQKYHSAWALRSPLLERTNTDLCASLFAVLVYREHQAVPGLSPPSGQSTSHQQHTRLGHQGCFAVHLRNDP